MVTELCKTRATNIGFAVIVLILILFSSCELFFVPRHGRERPGDEEAQITGFRALQHSAGTVTAEFGWKPPRDYYDDYERVKEVRLFINKNTPYIFPVHFFDGDTLGGEYISYQTGQYAYSVEWSNLKAGEERWVTLYSRTEDGWRAPLYERVVVKDTPETPLLYPSVFSDYIISVRYDLGDAVENPTSYDISGELSASGQHRLAVVFFHELSSLDHVQTADLTMSATVNSGVSTAMIAPVFTLRDDDKDIMEKIDMSSSITIDLAAAALPAFDIGDVIKNAVLYETYAVAIFPEPFSDVDVTITANTEELTNIVYYPEN